jgi:large subunit ribosomal protein L4
MATKTNIEKKQKVSKETPLTVVVYDMKGEKVEDWQLPESIFGKKENKDLIAQAVRVFLANQRGQGAETKTRSQVAGGGAKPWKQKGTGRARAGSIRSPLWRGGGIIHGPHNRDFGLSFPKKMRQAALLVALSEKARAKDIAILNKLELKDPKTKLAAEIVKKLPLKSKTALVVTDKKTLRRAFDNLKNVELLEVENLNTYGVMATDSLVFTKEAVTELEKKLGHEKN